VTTSSHRRATGCVPPGFPPAGSMRCETSPCWCRPPLARSSWPCIARSSASTGPAGGAAPLRN